MSKFEECAILVGKSLGRELSGDEKKELGKAVSDLVKQYENGDRLSELNTFVMEGIEKLGKDIKTAALIQQRNAALNARAQINMTNAILNNLPGNPTVSFRALFGSSMADFKESKNGLYSQISSLQRYYRGVLASKLAQKDLIKAAKTASLKRDIFLAMHELNMPNPRQDLKTFAPDALEIAKIFNEQTEFARINANRVGGWINKLPGYVVRRSVDISKLQKAAGASYPIGSPEHAKAYLSFMLEHLDWNKTMPDVLPADRSGILKSIYQQRANGYSIKFGEGGPVGFQKFGNIGAKLSRERIYHFKSAESELAYHDMFGLGTSLLEDMVIGLNRMARDTAIMEKFGPNAEANMKEVIDTVKEKLHDQGKGHLINSLETEFDNFKKTHWPAMNGEMEIPGNQVSVAISQGLRLVEQVRDLAGITVAALPDIASQGSVARHFGERDMKSFLEGMAESVSSVATGIKQKLTTGKAISIEEISALAEQGILLDVLQIPMGTAGDLAVPGRLANVTQMFFKLNLVSGWTDRGKIASGMGTGHRHFLYSEFAMGNLPEGMQALFRQFGISSEAWDIIRKGAFNSDPKGRKFFTPEAIMTNAKEAFDHLPPVKNRIKNIYGKEAALIAKHQEADAQDVQYLAKKITSFESEKERAHKALANFSELKLDRASKASQYLKDQIDLVKAKLEHSEVYADIASYLKSQKNRETVQNFLYAVEDGAEAEGLSPRVNRTVDRIRREGGSHGEKLGQKQAKAEARIQELQKKIKDTEKEFGASLDDLAKNTAESIKKIEDRFLESALKIKDKIDARSARLKEYQQNIGKFIDSAREDARNELANNYRTLFSELAAMAVTEGGPMERAAMLKGTKPGTWLGEALRHFWLYKSFVYNHTRRHLGRELHGYRAERLSFGQAMMEMIKDPKGGSLAGMANLIIFSSMLGYMSDSVNDLRKGKIPRIPVDGESALKIWSKSMLKSGSLGIYGDFFFGELKNRFGGTVVDTIMGPTARTFADIMDLWGRFRAGDDLAAQAFKFSMNNTPFVNAAYNLLLTRWFFDYFLVYRLQEWINPGSLRRMERRLQKEQGQRYWFPPSRYSSVLGKR